MPLSPRSPSYGKGSAIEKAEEKKRSVCLVKEKARGRSFFLDISPLLSVQCMESTELHAL